MSCRLCGSNELTTALELAATPPANAFQPTAAAATALARYPVRVNQCARCSHAQLAHVVDPEVLFGDYVYVSGTSAAYIAHLENFQLSASAMLALDERDLVVEIGSNDGTLLGFFKAAGQRIVGVDPARAIAASANANGIPTINGFFDLALARDIRAEHGPARLIAANNVCAHIDDLSGVLEAISALLADDGEFWFEVSYLRAVMSDTLFDTIYHEHLDYHRLEPLAGFFARAGFVLWDAEPITTHGGSVRVRVARAGVREPSARVASLIGEERAMGLHRLTAWKQLQASIERAGVALTAALDQLESAGLSGAGYGAPAKATTLMHQFGLSAERLQYIVDDSPWKQGLHTPGLGIPVVASDHARAHPVDYLLVLAWNFAGPIVANNTWFSKKGGRFVIPLPELLVR
ncbi:MAG: class I SAM-dependent methyltransferase [Pseudomonadota bacterium]